MLCALTPFPEARAQLLAPPSSAQGGQATITAQLGSASPRLPLGFPSARLGSPRLASASPRLASSRLGSIAAPPPLGRISTQATLKAGPRGEGFYLAVLEKVYGLGVAAYVCD